MPRSRRTFLRTGATALAALAAPACAAAPTFRPVSLPSGGRAWHGRFLMRDVELAHVLRPATGTTAAPPGLYVPGSVSPAFARLDREAVLADFRRRRGRRALALINASFFERYEEATELTFPVKAAGRLVTGGSSRWGPCAAPADPRWAGVKLRALVWDAERCAIHDHDPASHASLGLADGLVSYAWRDHPAAVLLNDPVDRHQMLAVAASRPGGPTDTLHVLTVAQGRMSEGAAHLTRSGAQGPVLTLDGGPSAHLWAAGQGALVAARTRRLPHFLTILARG
jgi:hypothetical protein